MSTRLKAALGITVVFGVSTSLTVYQALAGTDNLMTAVSAGVTAFGFAAVIVVAAIIIAKEK